jgi:hypothetical protein
MLSVADPDLPIIEHALRVGKASRYGWMGADPRRDRRTTALASALGALSAVRVRSRARVAVDGAPVGGATIAVEGCAPSPP